MKTENSAADLYPAPDGYVETEDWFERHPRKLKAVLAIMFILAALVRLYDLDASGMLVDRDYTSAMFARDFYFSRSEDVAPWRRDIAGKTRQNQPILEPPITEWLVSWTYDLVGKEQLRCARILTSVFWLAGGIFLFSIARSLVSAEGAVFALGFYLFLPLSVLLSRSFQPDSLMMMLFLASLWSIVRYYEHANTGSLVIAALVAAATLVYRPLVLLPLLGAFTLPQLQSRGLWKGAFNRQTIIYVTISCLPMLLYYGHATFIAKTFGWKLATSFRFDLWLHHEYWSGWFNIAVDKFGLWALIAAAIGFVFLRPGLPRAIVTGLALGYLAFGLLFTMHIHTHDYYQAQLVPTVAIAAAPLVVFLARAILRSSGRWNRWFSILLVALLVLLPWAHRIKAGLHQAGFESPSTAREIGELVEHSDHVVFLSRYYGVPIQYFGEFTGAYWPRAIRQKLYREKGEHKLSVDERLQQIDFVPEYFVITFFRFYEMHHPDLAAYLQQSCVPKAITDEYLVYEQCRPLVAQNPEVQ